MTRVPRQFFRTDAATLANYTGPSGEPVFNTTTGRLHMQDGATAGGQPAALYDDLIKQVNIIQYRDINICAAPYNVDSSGDPSSASHNVSALQQAMSASKSLYFRPGAYAVNGTLRPQQDTHIDADTALSTRITRVGSYGDTFQCGAPDASAVANAINISNLAFDANHGLTEAAIYAGTASIANRASAGAAHISLYGGFHAIVENCQFYGLPFQMTMQGCIQTHIRRPYFSSQIWDDRTPALQEGIAALVLQGNPNFSNGNIETFVECPISDGFGSAPRTVTIGTTAVAQLQQDDIGPQYIFLVRRCEDFLVEGGYIAGANQDNFMFYPDGTGLVSEIMIKDVAIDECRNYGIQIYADQSSGVYYVTNLSIRGCRGNGQTRSNGFLAVLGAGAGAGVGAGIVLDGLVYDGGTLMAYRQSPIVLAAGQAMTLSGIVARGYNCFGGNLVSGNQISSGLFVGGTSQFVNSYGNRYGGGINNTAAGNYCLDGEFWAGNVHGTASNIRAMNLGASGGKVCTIPQTYPT